MPDSKITALTSISTSTDPANDPLVIVDVSDTSMAATGTTKKVTLNQLLGASGTATLASATITGDLTVDTSTLKVDSANDRVLIGTLSALGSAKLSIAGKTQADTAVAGDVIGNFNNTSATGYGFRIGGGSATGGYALSVNNNAGSEFHQISGTGIATWSNVGGVAGTAMTLNSTGLGVGAVPSNYRLYVSAAFASGLNGAYIECGEFNKKSLIVNHTNASVAVNLFEVQKTGTAQFLVDSSGNVGIGVAPSAWGLAGYKGLEIGVVGNGIFSGLGDVNISSNAYYNGGWKYAQSSVAVSSYQQNAGQHIFKTAASGTAGNAITFTQAMTLDASSNLLVATTNASFGTANGFRTGDTGGRLELGSASSTNANIGFDMYSTGAAAYRFYVGWGGTVFATNTTISAISDARLKENVQDIDVGLGAILALKPRKFDWKAGKGKDIKGDRGFIAQEFEQVFPNLIDEWKDAAPEGEAPYKSVRQDLIPVLVKAIQELTARVQTLETR